MSAPETLKRLRTGPRTKQNQKANKNIRIDENGIESYSDYFTDESTNGTIQPSLKENSQVTLSDRDRITLPSFALSTSNRSNLSTFSRRTKRSLRASNIETINNNYVINKSCNSLDCGNSILPEGSNEKLVCFNQEIDELPEFSNDQILDKNDSSTLSQKRAIANKSTGVDDDNLDKVSHGYNDCQALEAEHNGQTISEGNDHVPLNTVSGGQSVSSLTRSKNASISTKKRKRKKKCDLFSERKIRKKSSSKNLTNENLSLSPILPAQKKKFASSTPAVNRNPLRRICSTTSISEMASPIIVSETQTCDVPCLSHLSNDLLGKSQITIPLKKFTRKSAMSNKTILRHSGNERTIGGSSTVLPSFNSSKRVHYFETTFKKGAKNKGKIIVPKMDGKEGLRRSTRTRVAALMWYKGERVVYRWDDGWCVAGVTTPQKSCKAKAIHQMIKREAKKAEKNEKKKKGELSVHVPINEDLLQEDTSFVEIFDHKTQKFVHKRCIFKHDHCDKVSCVTKLAATDGDALVMSKTISHPDFMVGHLKIRPLQEKTLQRIMDTEIAFFIHKGKVEVTIHESSFILETLDMFDVLPGNVYGIKNLRNEEAHLVYFRKKDINQQNYSKT